MADDLREDLKRRLNVRCPTHGIPDCGPLLNGCSWPATLNAQANEILAEWSALLDVAEAAGDISFPSNPVGTFEVDGFVGSVLKAALDRLEEVRREDRM